MLSTATRSRWNPLLLLSVAAAVALTSTEAFVPRHAALFVGEQQAGRRSSSKHQQKHNTRHSHTRILYQTSVTNCSNTKTALSNGKVLDELKELNRSNMKMHDELKELNTSNTKMVASKSKVLDKQKHYEDA
jgi:predicted transcriptional regulator